VDRAAGFSECATPPGAAPDLLTMLDLRRLFTPRMRQRAGEDRSGDPRRSQRAPLSEERRASRPALTAQMALMGRAVEASFIANGPRAKLRTGGRMAFVDLGHGESAYFMFPELERAARPPIQSAFPLKPGARYAVSGALDLLGEPRVSLYLIYYDDEERVHRDGVRVRPGVFTLESTAPADASKVVLAFRAAGQGSFAIRDLSVLELPGTEEGQVDESRRVVMIVLNEIVHDGRVLKTARALIDDGYDVTLFGMWRDGTAAISRTRIAGANALIFPDPASFLRGAGVRALRWEHMVAYLRACMWSHVERIGPRFVHTHDYHALPLGFEFVQRLRDGGRRAHWLHDFHEYVAGIDQMAPDWQRVALEHEARGIGLIDHRLTVSPMIRDWLQERYHLSEPPTVVLNAPPSSAVQADLGRTIRSDLGLDPEVDLIVFTGGVSEARNLHTVVSALAACPGCHLALVTNNTGDYVDRLGRIAAEGGYADRLHLLPYVRPHEVTAYVRDASVGLIPYRRSGNANAAMPNKLFDYLHAGLPIVASRLDLIQECLRQWQIGEVFDEGSVPDCAAAIGRVLSNQAFYRDNIRSNEGLRREATWDTQAEKILEAYRQLQAPAEVPAVVS
jgi:glycosyltransferase involved in cell wall biosynthesis